MEVGLQQPFLHGVLLDRRVGLCCQPDDPMGQQRVGSQGTIHPELEAHLGSPLGHVRDDRRRFLRPPELLRVGIDHWTRGPGRCRRVELVRVIRHIEVDLDAGHGQFGLDLSKARGELAFADVAPRTHHV